MTEKEEFVTLCRSVKRPGMNELLEWLETTDFYSAPASAKYHGAVPGGLLTHSLNVYREFRRLLDAYPEIECGEESAIICPLMHDFCKINFYLNEKRNRKNERGVWETYDAYTYNEKFCFGGHGSKSVYLIQNFMRLSPEEAVAINCHMGAFDNEHVGQSYEQFPLAWVLHVADEAATYITESKR